MWSDNESMLGDISRFSNMGNKEGRSGPHGLEISWSCKMFWSSTIKSPKEMENTKDKLRVGCKHSFDQLANIPTLLSNSLTYLCLV